MDSPSQTGAAGNSNSSSDFVRKLYKMLEDPAYEEVVRWGNDGCSFVVLENERFTKTILPKHFKHSNFASFVRQLNKYDFHKVRHNNEENGLSPYGPGAWEFKHPEFKANNKDSLDNIRRKAPAPRKSVIATVNEELPPTPQMDVYNNQLAATQQQVQQLAERYDNLSMHNTMLINELVSVQKSLINHEQIMQNLMSYLHTTDSFIKDQRRNSQAAGLAATSQENGSNVRGLSSSVLESPAPDDGIPSPLRNAERLLNTNSTDRMLNSKGPGQTGDLYRYASRAASSPASDAALSRQTTAQTSLVDVPTSATSSTSMSYGRFNGTHNEAVYPAGANNGIDPMFSEHVNNIPYPMPSPGDTVSSDPRNRSLEQRKKSTTIDPGWIRKPQILLVEDDPTCRRIGGKFLYSFHCAIDSALDGLEAVQKMNAGSKYDLVLMDIVMPNLDGVSACHLIRQFDSTPIIAMTSNIRSDDISMYFAHGMNDVLPKPFTKEGLLTMLEKHLSHLKDHRDKGVDGLIPPTIPQNGLRQPSKNENSQGKSPGPSNWQSPTQMPGASPTSHVMNEEFMSALRGSAGYGVNSATTRDSNSYPSPATPVSTKMNGGHRRQVSDMSGPDDMTVDMKRQRIFTTPMTNASMAAVQRSRQVS